MAVRTLLIQRAVFNALSTSRKANSIAGTCTTAARAIVLQTPLVSATSGSSDAPILPGAGGWPASHSPPICRRYTLASSSLDGQQLPSVSCQLSRPYHCRIPADSHLSPCSCRPEVSCAISGREVFEFSPLTSTTQFIIEADSAADSVCAGPANSVRIWREMGPIICMGATIGHKCALSDVYRVPEHWPQCNFRGSNDSSPRKYTGGESHV